MERLLDTRGNPVTKGAVWIAQYRNPDSTITIYRKTPQDIEKLISDLKSKGETDMKLLQNKFWEDNSCSKQDANSCSDGDCPDDKSCQQVTTSSNFSYCMCKANSL